MLLTQQSPISGFNTSEIGMSYIIMKTINYICIFLLIIYFMISITFIGNFTSYLNQQIILLIFIAMAFASDYVNFCTNSSPTIQEVRNNLYSI